MKPLLHATGLLPLLLLAACSTSQQRQPYTAPKPVTTTVTPQPAAVAPVVVEPQEPKGIPGNILEIPGKNQPGYQNLYPAGTYAHFVAKPAYPKTMEVYSNDALLQQLTKDNSKIIICIPQQRARLYINNQVALDWPVSTGTNGHETPTGVFRVLEKEKDHHSNRYGKFISGSGKVSNSNADLGKGIPQGHSFQGASMPNWLRLTPDGVGIHGGRVVAGRRLSHGCIRTPYAVAAKLFEHAVMGMPVYVTRAVEDYNRGGYVKPIDVKYRPKPGNDYTDMPIANPKILPS